LLVQAVTAVAGEVPLTKTGGVYTVPVRINGTITLDFIVDSGAADVSVPADVVLTLIRAHTVTDDDFLPGATYTLADGTQVQSPRFILRSVQIGSRVLRNVPAAIGELRSRLLLGQSVLERLGHWSMDARRGVLAFGDDGGAATADVAGRAGSGSIPGGSGTPSAVAAAATASDSGPVDAVRRYYGLIAGKQYWDAWNAMSDAYRASIHNDFAGWVAGFRTTHSVAVISASLAQSSGDLATVLFTLQSVDVLADGATMTKVFQGTWTVARSGRGWVLAKPSVREVR
jgi:hypothetical protein